MRTTIDAGGRVVIPKQLRDAADLAPGQELEVIERDGRIEIEPVSPRMALVERDGFLAAEIEGDAAPSTPEQVRDVLERTRRLASPPATTLIDAALQAGISGGAVYDLLVGLAATQAGATLLSLDRRTSAHLPGRRRQVRAAGYVSGGTRSPSGGGPGGVPSPNGCPPSSSRPCAVSQPDTSGPRGTTPVGLIVWCTP